MQIQFCSRSWVAGAVAGGLITAAAWIGVSLAGQANITQALLASAHCDPAGVVSIRFPDTSEFTCIPKDTAAPTSREEALRRKRGGA